MMRHGFVGLHAARVFSCAWLPVFCAFAFPYQPQYKTSVMIVLVRLSVEYGMVQIHGCSDTPGSNWYVARIGHHQRQ